MHAAGLTEKRRRRGEITYLFSLIYRLSFSNILLK